MPQGHMAPLLLNLKMFSEKLNLQFLVFIA